MELKRIDSLHRLPGAGSKWFGEFNTEDELRADREEGGLLSGFDVPM